MLSNNSFMPKFAMDVMRRSAALVAALLVVLLVDEARGEPTQNCLIKIHLDGTCEAAGLHVPCSEIGPELRRAGVPADANIRFGQDRSVGYDVVSATIRSVARAGFTNMKIGFITERAH